METRNICEVTETTESGNVLIEIEGKLRRSSALTKVIESVEECSRRLENVIVEAGSTEGNAELTDIRLGSDGTVYPTAGDAVREQIEGAFRGQKTIITASNYTEILSDMNEVISNRIYAISENPPILNGPENVTLSGVLVIFSCRNGASTHAGVLQLFYTTSGALYMRQKWGTGTAWKDWVRINQEIPKSVLYGKTIYNDGDSIAIGTHSWDENHQIPYADQIAELYSMTLTNAAVSGTTLAVREGRTDSILERVTANLKGQSVEYIVLEGGINDVFNDVPVGVVEDSYTASFDTSTSLGALETLCALLMRRYPDSKKLFILAHRITGWYEKQNALFDKMILVLEKWGIPYIDMRKESELFALNDTLNEKFFYESDGIHPLKETYETHYVPKIVNKLISI